MTIELYKNTFVTLEEAEIYFEERFDSNEWFQIEEKEKEALLTYASKKINRLDFTGTKAEEAQPMEFPRNFGTPQDIKDAVCEEAISLLKGKENTHIQNQENNISSISLGVGAISYVSNIQNNEATVFKSKTALYLIKKWTKKGYNIPF